MIDIEDKKTSKPTDKINYDSFSPISPSAMINELYKYSGLLTYFRKNSEVKFSPKLLYPTISEDQSRVMIKWSEHDEFECWESDNIIIDNQSSGDNNSSISLFSQLLSLTPTYLNLNINGNLNKNIEILLDGDKINISNDIYEKQILVLPHININLEKGSSASVAMSAYNFDNDDMLLYINGTNTLGERSNLSYLSLLHSRLKGLISEVNLTSNLEEKSTFSHYYFQNEATLSRNNTQINMQGEYAEANLYGLSVLSGRSEVDNYSNIHHIKPNCTSNQLYKTVVNDNAKSIFNGRILVEQDSQKTLAYQTNKSLVLSPDAKVRTKPQLEIFADDVKCSHGATIGQIDETQLFFLQCRGISREEAKRLLIDGFTNEIIAKVTNEGFRQLIQHSVEK